MTRLANITNTEKNLITRVFPNLRHALEHYANDYLGSKVAISIFNRWLGKDELHLLDSKSQKEREERNARMLCFWDSIYKLTDVYTYTSTSQKADSQQITFMRYLNKGAYLSSCIYNPTKTSDQFQFIILPEFQAICYESWDDTNILWYVSKETIRPLLEQANICGLHVIDFAS